MKRKREKVERKCHWCGAKEQIIARDGPDIRANDVAREKNHRCKTCRVNRN